VGTIPSAPAGVDLAHRRHPVTRQDRWRRPDALAVTPDGTAKVAFEVQYSALTGTDWKARHDFYADAGVVDIWLFRPPRLPVDASRRRTSPGPRRERSRLGATVQLNGLHQKMLEHGVIPLWFNPTAHRMGTATAAFHLTPRLAGRAPGEDHRLQPSAARDLSRLLRRGRRTGTVRCGPRRPGAARSARRVQREEHERFLADGQAT
jgi:hypothetical protein